MTCRPEWISPSSGGEGALIRIQLYVFAAPQLRSRADDKRRHAYGDFRHRVHSSPGRALLGRGFPVFSVERRRRELGNVDIVETAGVDVDLAGVRARHVEGMNAAMLAERVLRRLCVEFVGGEVVLAADELEALRRDDQVQNSLLDADRAIAIDH